MIALFVYAIYYYILEFLSRYFIGIWYHRFGILLTVLRCLIIFPKFCNDNAIGLPNLSAHYLKLSQYLIISELCWCYCIVWLSWNYSVVIDLQAWHFWNYTARFKNFVILIVLTWAFYRYYSNSFDSPRYSFLINIVQYLLISTAKELFEFKNSKSIQISLHFFQNIDQTWYQYIQNNSNL